MNKGGIIIQVLAFASIGVFLLAGFVNWGVLSIKLARETAERAQALAIAEAGIDYYRWHLAHDPLDFQDGTGGPGPYVHNFEDKNGTVIGTFTLDITPPMSGSTLVTIRSTGRVLSNPSISRTIETRLAKPSLAKFAWVLNDFVQFGSTAEVFGPIHTNSGIRFDGLAHNIVSSGVSSFDDPGHSGGNEFGVHTHKSPTDPLPPAPVPSRPDVFMAGREFPVPTVDFAGLTADLATLKADAQAGGKYYGPSGANGYHIVLKTNDKFDIYRVNSLLPAGSCPNSGQTGWGTWSINTAGGSESTVALDVDFPANGLIFVEDHLWIDGQINSARLTIGAGTFPDNSATRKSIIVNKDLLYTNYDGQDVIGLIAQNDFNVGLLSEDDLRIDAAIIAQNGRVGRFSYRSSSCGSERGRTLLTSYGMLGSNKRAAFYYGTNNGYAARTYIYDANLLYGPPPSFPLTTDEYQILSWEEL